MSPITPSVPKLLRVGAPMMGERKMLRELHDELDSIARKKEFVTMGPELPYLNSRTKEIEILLDFMAKRQQQQQVRSQLAAEAATATWEELATAANAAPETLLDDFIVVGEAVFSSGAPVAVLADLIEKLEVKSQAAAREAEVKDLVRRLKVIRQTQLDYPMADRFRSISGTATMATRDFAPQVYTIRY